MTCDPPPNRLAPGRDAAHGIYCRIVRAPRDGVTVVTLLDDALLGVVGHWDRQAGRSRQGRFRPHLQTDCPQCQRALGKIQFFWISAWSAVLHEVVRVELRGDAVRPKPDLHPERGVKLRGAGSRWPDIATRLRVATITGSATSLRPTCPRSRWAWIV